MGEFVISYTSSKVQNTTHTDQMTYNERLKVHLKWVMLYK